MERSKDFVPLPEALHDEIPQFWAALQCNQWSRRESPPGYPADLITDSITDTVSVRDGLIEPIREVEKFDVPAVRRLLCQASARDKM